MLKHRVEVLSAGCPLCQEVIRLVQWLSGDSSEVEVLDVRQAKAADYAKTLGIRAFPAVILDGQTITFDVGAALEQSLQECEWLREFLNERSESKGASTLSDRQTRTP